MHLDADEHVRLPRVGVAVVELGDVALAEQRAELAEAARALRDGHREHRLALLAELGALGDEAQPVEVHVRAAGDRDQRLVRAAACRSTHALAPATASAPAGSSIDARVLEHVLDRRADLVGVDEDHLVDQLAAQAERLLADLLHRHAVGEQADVRRACTRRPAFERARHRVGVDRLDADDLDLAAARASRRRRCREISPPPPIGDEDRVDRPGVLAQDLHADRALPGDHVRDRRRDARTSAPRRCCSARACA